MSYEFRRGAAEIQKSVDAAAAGGDGKFRPFLSNFFWKDGDERFLLILNPVEDIPKVLMQEVWINTGRKAHAIARTDQAIGERVEPMEDAWNYTPTERNVAVAVELEPTFEVVKGRQRPTGFEVKVRTFERRIRDDKGELTDEREEVTAPEVGVIIQSPNNFFKHIAHKDATVAPITEVALQITRLGGGTDTDYEITAFESQQVDISALIECADGISYLGDDLDAVLDTIDKMEDDEAALHLGSVLLDKRLDEMADEDYYNEILDQIDEPARFGKKAKSEQAKPARQARPSQRRTRQAEPEVEASDGNAEAVEAPEEKPKRSRARRAAPVSRTSPVQARLAELRDETTAK